MTSSLMRLAGLALALACNGAAWAQQPGSPAAAAIDGPGRPAMSGAQGGAGSNSGLAQGGIGVQGNAAQQDLVLRRGALDEPGVRVERGPAAGGPRDAAGVPQPRASAGTAAGVGATVNSTSPGMAPLEPAPAGSR